MHQRIRKSTDMGTESYRKHLEKQKQIINDTNKRLGLSREGKVPSVNELMRSSFSVNDNIQTQTSIEDGPVTNLII